MKGNQERIFIKDDNNEKYFLSVLAEMDDEAGRIEVELRLAPDKTSSGREPAHVKVTAQIRNPLEIITVFLVHAVAHYGLCVGLKLMFAGGTMCLQSYREIHAGYFDVGR